MGKGLHLVAEYVVANGRVTGEPGTPEFSSSLVEEILYEVLFDPYEQWELDATRKEVEEWVYARY